MAFSKPPDVTEAADPWKGIVWKECHPVNRELHVHCEELKTQIDDCNARNELLEKHFSNITMLRGAIAQKKPAKKLNDMRTDMEKLVGEVKKLMIGREIVEIKVVEYRTMKVEETSPNETFIQLKVHKVYQLPQRELGFLSSVIELPTRVEMESKSGYTKKEHLGVVERFLKAHGGANDSNMPVFSWHTYDSEKRYPGEIRQHFSDKVKANFATFDVSHLVSGNGIEKPIAYRTLTNEQAKHYKREEGSMPYELFYSKKDSTTGKDKPGADYVLFQMKTERIFTISDDLCENINQRILEYVRNHPEEAANPAYDATHKKHKKKSEKMVEKLFENDKTIPTSAEFHDDVTKCLEDQHRAAEAAAASSAGASANQIPPEATAALQPSGSAGASKSASGASKSKASGSNSKSVN